MLSVGREINIAARRFICRQCPWEGMGSGLASGLIKISKSNIYLCAYRCPKCASFDVASKAKLLVFRPRGALRAHEGVGPRADEAPELQAALKENK
jgi:hypothetical protein